MGPLPYMPSFDDLNVLMWRVTVHTGKETPRKKKDKNNFS
jgi:hypothetical protein